MSKGVHNNDYLQRDLIDSNYKVIRSISAFRKELNKMFVRFVFMSLIFQLAIQALVEFMRMRSYI